jgi:hypothetical protein
MEIKDYLELSEKTLSYNFYAEEQTKLALNETVEDIVIIGDRLDLIKKVLFYGKDIKLETRPNEPNDTFTTPDLKKQIILHGAIGMVTESIELLKEVFAAIKEERDFDTVNIFEELGDENFYQAIFLREFNFELGNVWDTNINKLKARYGENFSSEKAMNRDLVNESEVLTQGLNK